MPLRLVIMPRHVNKQSWIIVIPEGCALSFTLASWRCLGGCLALPQQSNERGEKAFNFSSIAYHSSLFTWRQMYSQAHPCLMSNGNSSKYDRYKFIITWEFLLKYRRSSSVICVENTVWWKNGLFYYFAVIMIREKIAVERTTRSLHLWLCVLQRWLDIFKNLLCLNDWKCGNKCSNSLTWLKRLKENFFVTKNALNICLKMGRD